MRMMLAGGKPHPGTVQPYASFRNPLHPMMINLADPRPPLLPQPTSVIAVSNSTVPMRAESPTPSQTSSYRTGSTPTTPQGYMSPTPFINPTFQNSLGWASNPMPGSQSPVIESPNVSSASTKAHVYPPRFNGSVETDDKTVDTINGVDNTRTKTKVSILSFH